MPDDTAVCTTSRNACCPVASAFEKLSSSIRLTSPGFLVNAARTSESSAARIMQPARQIFATSARAMSYLYSWDAWRSRAIPCAYDVIFAAYRAWRVALISWARWPGLKPCATEAFGAVEEFGITEECEPEAFGPRSTLLAATRSDFSAETSRASTAALTVGIGAPTS